MILTPNTLPEEVAFVLEQAVTALRAAAEDGSEVARCGLEEVNRCLGYIGAVGGAPLTDIETWADRKEELQALYAELNAEEYGPVAEGARSEVAA